MAEINFNFETPEEEKDNFEGFDLTSFNPIVQPELDPDRDDREEGLNQLFFSQMESPEFDVTPPQKVAADVNNIGYLKRVQNALVGEIETVTHLASGVVGFFAGSVIGAGAGIGQGIKNIASSSEEANRELLIGEVPIRDPSRLPTDFGISDKEIGPIDLNRPLLKNPDGSFSTEQTITIDKDGKFFNIPTIINGEKLSDEEAIRRSKPVSGPFDTVERAVEVAKARSRRINQVRGVGGEEPPTDFIQGGQPFNRLGNTSITAADKLSSVFFEVTERLTYQPETEEGIRYVEAINETVFERIQRAREFVGEKAAGGEGSIEEFLQSSDPAVTVQIPKAFALRGALGEAAIDTALILAGSMLFRGTLKAGKGKQPKTSKTDVEIPSDLKVENFRLDTLQELRDAGKTTLKTEADVNTFIKRNASGELRSQIVVETIEGLPVRILGGQNPLFVLGELQRRGKVNVRSVKVRTIERVSKSTPEVVQAAAKTDAIFTSSEAAVEAAQKGIKRTLIQKLKAVTLDSAANVRAELLKRGGETGRRAVRDLELAEGASPRAHFMAEQAYKRIYKGLSFSAKRNPVEFRGKAFSERQFFDRYLRARRIVAIGRTKTKGDIPRFEGNVKPQDAANWISEARKSLGDAKFVEFEVRAEAFFDTMATELRKMLDEGLITKTDFNNLRGIDYLRTDFINRLDPAIAGFEAVSSRLGQGGQKISVGESGIELIGRGSTKDVILDSESLMRESLVRVENRIARNRANQQLSKLAKESPANGIVTVKGKGKVPIDKAEINVRIGGETETLWMDKVLAQEWTLGSPEISTGFANTLRVASGNFLVRPLATGYNPGFIATNLPRDIVHSWLAINNQYSTFLPKFLGEMGRDMAATLKDAATKTGRYIDYIDEGGGMDFLVHQGRDAFKSSRQSEFVKRVNPKLKKVKDGLSYLNELSEVWIRLAIRERVIRNQKTRGLAVDPTEGTHIARAYLDFARGGSMMKAADNAIPYLNAGTQALRTAIRGAKNNPVQFGAKITQLAGVYAGWEAYNYIYHPEAHDQIPERNRRESMQIHTDHFIIDDQGNQRWLYYEIKKDPFVTAFTAPIESLVQKHITGREPTDSVFEYIQRAIPLATLTIPTLEAMYTIQSEHNFWTDNDLWGRGRNIEEFAKFRDFPSSNPTNPLFRDIGRIVDISPEALQAGFRDLAPTNTYTQIGGQFYRWVRQQAGGEVDPRQLGESTEEWLSDMPLVDRVYKLTHPAIVAIDEAERVARPVNTERELAVRELDRILFFQKVGQESEEAAVSFAEGFQESDPFLFQSLRTRVETKKRLDRLFDRHRASLRDLPRSWWLTTAAMQSAARAAAYHNEWSTATSERRQWMQRVANQLTGTGLTYRDKPFEKSFRELKSAQPNLRQIGITQESERHKVTEELTFTSGL